MRVFLDTSAFVKRYVQESGSEKVLQLCGEADALSVSIICLPEMIATLQRLVRESKLSDQQYQQIKARVLEDLADADVCELVPAIMHKTLGTLENYSLRAMDAIHIGCALVYAPDVFVSGDYRQIVAAKGAGLQVIQV